jgi:membrane protein implicated in regulation of membrane protease activity
MFMKAISGVLLILGLAIFIYTKHGMIHFALRPWSMLVVGVSLLAVCVAMGWRNVLNAFKGRDQEAGRRALDPNSVDTVVFLNKFPGA